MIFSKHWKICSILMYIQGVSYWNEWFWMALRGRRVDNFLELWFLVGSAGLDIWVSLTSFQKSNIRWPQQPQTEKVLNSTWYFMILPKNNCFQNIKIKLNSTTWMTLECSVVIFQALEYLWPQWPQQPQQPQWPQWPQQPHFKKEITEFYVSINPWDQN